MEMATIRRRVSQKVARMSQSELSDWLAAYHANWQAHKSIVSEPIKRLTGGFNSQSINAYTVRRVYDELRNR